MRPILGKLRGWVLPVALAAALGAGGCGPGSGTISGKVVNGQGTALKGGTVVFYADKDHPFGPVQITKEGTYKIENVPAGDYIVTVETDSMKPPPPNAHVNAAPPDAKGGAQASTANTGELYVPIPASYGDPTKSDLKCTVKPGKNEYNPPLK